MRSTIPPAHHQARLRAESRFKRYGQGAIGLALVMLVILLISIAWRGVDGFRQTQLQLDITFDAALLEMKAGEPISALPVSVFSVLAQQSLRAAFPDITDKAQARLLSRMVSIGAGRTLKHYLLRNPQELGKTVLLWVPAASDLDQFAKGHTTLSATVEKAYASLFKQGRARLIFNDDFLRYGDSRAPEQAGFLASIIGSLLTVMVCMALALPLGVATALYLEEFAPKNRFTDLIEVNINNLAAVPSIVFGLLGLAVYINVFGMPRSSALVGGLTLALMVLPVIIITTRISIKAVPQSIRDAALALGASKWQAVLHHVLPLSMPGIMTGAILGMARALGETAPLILIGMVAFVADLPGHFTDPATAMPVQIYLWASSPEAGFSEKTSAGIAVLLLVLLMLNAVAIVIRKKFETRW